jgi:hypothetical protein
MRYIRKYDGKECEVTTFAELKSLAKGSSFLFAGNKIQVVDDELMRVKLENGWNDITPTDVLIDDAADDDTNWLMALAVKTLKEMYEAA